MVIFRTRYPGLVGPDKLTAGDLGWGHFPCTWPGGVTLRSQVQVSVRDYAPGKALELRVKAKSKVKPLGQSRHGEVEVSRVPKKQSFV